MQNWFINFFKVSNRYVDFLLITFITLILIYIFYSNRWIFFYKYEPEYFENYYYHSQWSYPGSKRGISDGLLYQFVGYRLVEGGNPFWVSISLYLLSLFTIYLLAAEVYLENNGKIIKAYNLIAYNHLYHKSSFKSSTYIKL